MKRGAQRRLWTAAHRYAGLIVSLLLLSAGATGCILCFEKPLDRWLNPELFTPRVSGATDPIGAVEALELRDARVVATSFQLEVPQGQNILVHVEPRRAGQTLKFDQVLLDRGDGRTDGQRQTAPGWDRPHLLRSVYLAHFTLLAGDLGRWLMGAAALVWLLTSLVGLYLAWPKAGPFWRSWTSALTLNFRGKAARLLFDIHRAGGLWLLAPLCLLAFTSVGMNFFNEALVPAVRAVSPPRPSPFDQPEPLHPGLRTIPFTKALAAASTTAARERPGWRAAAIQYEPARNLIGIRFTRSGQETYRGFGPVTYWVGGGDARFVARDDPYKDSAGAKLIRGLYPLHTGEMIGLFGVAADLLLGVATMALSGTGIYLWVKRRPGRVAAHKMRRARTS